ncbi:tyrosine-type recombinase/integrase [Halorubrum terrestre]|uniref:Tyrosine-type recombinase/integrase n=1 Tax=Halorubrum distributum TaxID=29283 RepID=A0A6B1IQQ1_9EURY|nr:site-specific integrase [Halorubrum terrestre]MYL17365.1 tyrosine-type recombinase/integrase [Halorubrum terrestre]
MRIDDSGKRTKVWLDDDEADTLQRTLDKQAWERGIAGMLMLRCGLRSEETTTVSPGDVERDKDGESWFLEVQGKNTKGGEKTTRKAWLPDDVERELLKFSRERGIEDDDPYLPYSPRTIQNWITNASETGAADVLAESDPSEDWEHVSSHDLRRHWAHYHLVEERVAPRVMMSIGGWSSYSAIEPYLTEPSTTNIIEEMSAVQN